MSGTGEADELAEKALRRLRSAPAPSNPFTCDLSVDELVLVEQAGLEPLQMVMGTSVISVRRRSTIDSGEVPYATDALYRARHRAIEDLRKEATLVRAHGVVGVRVEVDAERWGEDLHEFVAFGTAVRSRTRWLPGARHPFSSHLSGQGIAALLAAGYRPLSLVMGAAVWGMSTFWAAGRRRGELTRFTLEFTTARELAIRRMGAEARVVRAAGVVGVSIEQRSHAWGGGAVEFLALGTAVRPWEGRTRAPAPRAVVAVDAPTPRAAQIRVDVEPLGRPDF